MKGLFLKKTLNTVIGCLLVGPVLVGCGSDRCEKLVASKKHDVLTAAFRKQHAADGSVMLPEPYNKPILSGSERPIQNGDTIYLKASDRDIVEFRLEGDSLTQITGVQLKFKDDGRWQTDDPHIDRRNKGLYIKGKDALFIFNPWVHVEEDDNVMYSIVSYSYDNCNCGKAYPIKVLTDAQYSTFISNRQPTTISKKMEKVRNKYQSRLSTCWETKAVGSGRSRKLFDQFNVDKFFGGLKYSEGKYSNEYVANDGTFKITLTVDDSPSVIVEPLKLSL